MSDDRFALEEGGGGLDGFTGTVTDAFFSDGDYGLSLKLVSAFDDPENYVRFEDGTFSQFYSCGKDWQTGDGGETATHPGGPDKRFNKSSKIGQLIGAVAAIPGIADALPADWSAYRASSWKGLHLTWGKVPVEQRKQVNGEWKTVEAQVLLPVALAGQTGTNGAGTVDIAALGLDQSQIISLAAVAQSTDTPGKFIEAIATQPGVTSNSAFMGAVGKDAQGVKDALAAATF